MIDARHPHALMYVLSAIVLLNVIFIVVLQERIGEREDPVAVPVVEKPAEVPIAPRITVPPKPEVRALLLWDRGACPDCFDIGVYADALEGTMNLTISDGDPRAFETYLLTRSTLDPRMLRLPAIAFDKNIERYPELVKDWEATGYIVEFPDTSPHPGKWYVLPSQNPPYYRVGDHAILGSVNVTYLTLSACGACSGTDVLRDALSGVGITPASERTIDVGTPAGSATARRFGVTKVPAMLLSPDAGEYPGLRLGWSVVGTVEPDGTYVLHDPSSLKMTYYDLTTKDVVTP